eukprot:31794_1
MMSVLHSLIIITLLICVNSQNTAPPTGIPAIAAPTHIPTHIPTASPIPGPTAAPIPGPTAQPSKSPSGSPTTQQFTEIKNIVLTGTFEEFKQYAIDNGLTVDELAFEYLKSLISDPDLLKQA